MIEFLNYHFINRPETELNFAAQIIKPCIIVYRMKKTGTLSSNTIFYGTCFTA